MTLDQDRVSDGVRYNFSAEGGSLRTEDGGRTWTKATREDIDRDFKRAEGEDPAEPIASGSPSAPTLDQDIVTVREAAHAEQPLQGQVDAADAALDRLQAALREAEEEADAAGKMAAQLVAENERLREALEQIATETDLKPTVSQQRRFALVARAALETKETQ